MGFSRDKDGEKLRENSDSYSGMYLSEGRGGGGGEGVEDFALGWGG